MKKKFEIKILSQINYCALLLNFVMKEYIIKNLERNLEILPLIYVLLYNKC